MVWQISLIWVEIKEISLCKLYPGNAPRHLMVTSRTGMNTSCYYDQLNSEKSEQSAKNQLVFSTCSLRSSSSSLSGLRWLSKFRTSDCNARCNM